MKSNQVTIKDIARELGISPSTVSRALKDHPDISPATKEAVNKLAEELNYQPNSIALSLRHQKSNTIGVIIPEIVHFFFATVIAGIEDVAYDAGYSVIISQSNESYERELIDTKAMFNNRVDGILISKSRESEDVEHFRSLHKRGMPLVFFDRDGGDIPCSNVLVNDIQGGLLATEHLISQGCRRIAHNCAPLGLNTTGDRFQGYKQALENHNIPFDPSLIIKDEMGTDHNDARRVFGEFYDAHSNKPDGVFANNDMIALGVIQALKERNVRVPEDVAVVGFSNWQFTALTEPTLSTISQPGYEMGKEAAKLLIEEIEAEDGDVITTTRRVLETSLVVRNSSRRK